MASRTPRAPRPERGSRRFARQKAYSAPAPSFIRYRTIRNPDEQEAPPPWARLFPTKLDYQEMMRQGMSEPGSNVLVFPVNPMAVLFAAQSYRVKYAMAVYTEILGELFDVLDMIDPQYREDVGFVYDQPGEWIKFDENALADLLWKLAYFSPNGNLQLSSLVSDYDEETRNRLITALARIHFNPDLDYRGDPKEFVPLGTHAEYLALGYPNKPPNFGVLSGDGLEFLKIPAENIELRVIELADRIERFMGKQFILNAPIVFLGESKPVTLEDSDGEDRVSAVPVRAAFVATGPIDNDMTLYPLGIQKNTPGAQPMGIGAEMLMVLIQGGLWKISREEWADYGTLWFALPTPDKRDANGALSFASSVCTPVRLYKSDSGEINASVGIGPGTSIEFVEVEFASSQGTIKWVASNLSLGSSGMWEGRASRKEINLQESLNRYPEKFQDVVRVELDQKSIVLTVLNPFVSVDSVLMTLVNTSAQCPGPLSRQIVAAANSLRDSAVAEPFRMMDFLSSETLNLDSEIREKMGKLKAERYRFAEYVGLTKTLRKMYDTLANQIQALNEIPPMVHVSQVGRPDARMPLVYYVRDRASDFSLAGTTPVPDALVLPDAFTKAFKAMVGKAAIQVKDAGAAKNQTLRFVVKGNAKELFLRRLGMPEVYPKILVRAESTEEQREAQRQLLDSWEGRDRFERYIAYRQYAKDPVVGSTDQYLLFRLRVLDNPQDSQSLIFDFGGSIGEPNRLNMNVDREEGLTPFGIVNRYNAAAVLSYELSKFSAAEDIVQKIDGQAKIFVHRMLTLPSLTGLDIRLLGNYCLLDEKVGLCPEDSKDPFRYYLPSTAGQKEDSYCGELSVIRKVGVTRQARMRSFTRRENTVLDNYVPPVFMLQYLLRPKLSGRKHPTDDLRMTGVAAENQRNLELVFHHTVEEMRKISGEATDDVTAKILQTQENRIYQKPSLAGTSRDPSIPLTDILLDDKAVLTPIESVHVKVFGLLNDRNMDIMRKRAAITGDQLAKDSLGYADVAEPPLDIQLYEERAVDQFPVVNFPIAETEWQDLTAPVPPDQQGDRIRDFAGASLPADAIQSQVVYIKRRSVKESRHRAPPKKITSFSGEYDFLLPSYPCPVRHKGVTYPSAEHAYLAAKTSSSRVRLQLQARNLGIDAARRLAKKAPIVSDWDDDKFFVMKDIQASKFQDNPDLMRRLMATGGADLIYGNTSDMYWGVIKKSKKTKGGGENNLGLILQNVRADLAEAHPESVPSGIQVIDHFRGYYFFLSNFYPANISFEGDVYPSLEHAYQAAKCANLADRAAFQGTVDMSEEVNEREAVKAGAAAKKDGAKVTIVPDWENKRVDVMRRLLNTKFNNPSLAALLAGTVPHKIVEGHTKDTFWGGSGKKGQNMLGRLLMEIRAKKAKPASDNFEVYSGDALDLGYFTVGQFAYGEDLIFIARVKSDDENLHEFIISFSLDMLVAERYMHNKQFSVFNARDQNWIPQYFPFYEETIQKSELANIIDRYRRWADDAVAVQEPSEIKLFPISERSRTVLDVEAEDDRREHVSSIFIVTRDTRLPAGRIGFTTVSKSEETEQQTRGKKKEQDRDLVYMRSWGPMTFQEFAEKLGSMEKQYTVSNYNTPKQDGSTRGDINISSKGGFSKKEIDIIRGINRFAQNLRIPALNSDGEPLREDSPSLSYFLNAYELAGTMLVLDGDYISPFTLMEKEWIRGTHKLTVLEARKNNGLFETKTMVEERLTTFNPSDALRMYICEKSLLITPHNNLQVPSAESVWQKLEQNEDFPEYLKVPFIITGSIKVNIELLRKLPGNPPTAKPDTKGGMVGMLSFHMDVPTQKMSFAPNGDSVRRSVFTVRESALPGIRASTMSKSMETALEPGSSIFGFVPVSQTAMFRSVVIGLQKRQAERLTSGLAPLPDALVLAQAYNITLLRAIKPSGAGYVAPGIISGRVGFGALGGRAGTAVYKETGMTSPDPLERQWATVEKGRQFRLFDLIQQLDKRGVVFSSPTEKEMPSDAVEEVEESEITMPRMGMEREDITVAQELADPDILEGEITRLRKTKLKELADSLGRLQDKLKLTNALLKAYGKQAIALAPLESKSVIEGRLMAQLGHSPSDEDVDVETAASIAKRIEFIRRSIAAARASIAGGDLPLTVEHGHLLQQLRVPASANDENLDPMMRRGAFDQGREIYEHAQHVFTAEMPGTEWKKNPRKPRSSRGVRRNPLTPSQSAALVQYAEGKSTSEVAENVLTEYRRESDPKKWQVQPSGINTLFPMAGKPRVTWEPPMRIQDTVTNYDLISRVSHPGLPSSARSAWRPDQKNRMREGVEQASVTQPLPFNEALEQDLAPVFYTGAELALDDAVAMIKSQRQSARNVDLRGRAMGLQPSAALCKLYRARRLSNFDLPRELTTLDGGRIFANDTIIVLSPLYNPQSDVGPYRPRVMTWRRGEHIDCDMIGDKPEDLLPLLARAVQSSMYWIAEKMKKRKGSSIWVYRAGTDKLYRAIGPEDVLTLETVWENLQNTPEKTIEQIISSTQETQRYMDAERALGVGNFKFGYRRDVPLTSRARSAEVPSGTTKEPEIVEDVADDE